MNSFDLNFLEPIITISALLLTGLNWIISQKLSIFNKRLESLENSFLDIQRQTTKFNKLKTKIDLLFTSKILFPPHKKFKRKKRRYDSR